MKDKADCTFCNNAFNWAMLLIAIGAVIVAIFVK